MTEIHFLSGVVLDGAPDQDQCQIRGQMAPSFGWVTFRWVNYIDSIA